MNGSVSFGSSFKVMGSNPGSNIKRKEWKVRETPAVSERSGILFISHFVNSHVFMCVTYWMWMLIDWLIDWLIITQFYLSDVNCCHWHTDSERPAGGSIRAQLTFYIYLFISAQFVLDLLFLFILRRRSTSELKQSLNKDSDSWSFS